MGHAHQLLGIGVGDLLRGFPPFSALLAGHRRLDELRRPDHGCCDLPGVGRLVHIRTQALCFAARRALAVSPCDFV